MKIAIITTYVGTDFVIPPPPLFSHEADYYYFSSYDLFVAGYVTRQLCVHAEYTNYGNRRVGKIPKFLSHYLLPDYDFYIWCDSNQQLNTSPQKLVKQFRNEDSYLLFKHPHRNCVYVEMEAVNGMRREDRETLIQTKEFLLKQFFPPNYGLFELTAYVRRNDKISNTIGSALYDLIQKYTSRDQILFPYLLKKYGGSYSVLTGTAQAHDGGNNYFRQIDPPIVVRYGD